MNGLCRNYDSNSQICTAYDPIYEINLSQKPILFFIRNLHHLHGKYHKTGPVTICYSLIEEIDISSILIMRHSRYATHLIKTFLVRYS